MGNVFAEIKQSSWNQKPLSLHTWGPPRRACVLWLLRFPHKEQLKEVVSLGSPGQRSAASTQPFPRKATDGALAGGTGALLLSPEGMSPPRLWRLCFWRQHAQVEGGRGGGRVAEPGPSGKVYTKEGWHPSGWRPKCAGCPHKSTDRDWAGQAAREKWMWGSGWWLSESPFCLLAQALSLWIILTPRAFQHGELPTFPSRCEEAGSKGAKWRSFRAGRSHRAPGLNLLT